MNKKFQKVGIAMAVYQPNLDFLIQQLESIQKQTYKDWQCVITADSSLDFLKTDHRFKVFVEDSRFHFHENPKRLGVKHNFEKAMQWTLALDIDALAFSDQDDIWLPIKLECCLRELNEKGPGTLVYSDMYVLRKKDGEWKYDSLTAWQQEARKKIHPSFDQFLIRNVAAGAGLLVDAEILRGHETFPEEIDYHDWWVSLLASRNGGLHAIYKPLYEYRQHGANVVGITPYKGLVSHNSNKSRLSYAKELYTRTQKRTQEMKQLGLLNSSLTELVYSKPYDLGLGFLVKAVAAYPKDKKLCRSYLARCVGKVAGLLHI